jgi:RNA polymerase sigma factor for flagellar operon FliA
MQPHRLQDAAETARGGFAGISFTPDALPATRSSTSHDPQMLDHLRLVRRIARHVARRLPCHFEIEDLVQAGMVGLLEAAQRYSGSISFEAYARYRIRGAILDSVRKSDWRQRLHHRRVRAIDAAKSNIENETGATAKSTDVVAALGWSIKVYHRTLQDSASILLLSLEDLRGDDGELERDPTISDCHSPADGLEKTDWHRALASAIDGLSEKEREILLLYYDGEYTLREIGIRVGLSESRVCQILRQSVRRLRSRMPAIDAGDLFNTSHANKRIEFAPDRGAESSAQPPTPATQRRMRNSRSKHPRSLALASIYP